jgi:hypothetical protein
MAPGPLPFGWTVGAGYARDDENRFKSRFEGKFVRGDVVVPIAAHFAVTGGVGYENIKQTQQDILRDSNGVPVVDANGDAIADPSQPRLTAYDTSGLIWDAGFIWRPGPRTELQVRGGRRYGSTSITGSFDHKFREGFGLHAGAYDAVDSFGHRLVSDLNNVPVDFVINPNPLNPGVGGTGCIFGTDPGSGVCFDDVLRSIRTGTFRTRGGTVSLSGGRGPWSLGLGASYNRRTYFAPLSGGPLNAGNVTDESYSFSAQATRKIGRYAGITGDAFVGRFGSGLPGAEPVWSAGVTGAYYRSLFVERMRLQAALGLYTTDSPQGSRTVGSALLGLRYSF